jgi:hypothetical protein
MVCQSFEGDRDPLQWRWIAVGDVHALFFGACPTVAFHGEQSLKGSVGFIMALHFHPPFLSLAPRSRQAALGCG